MGRLSRYWEVEGYRDEGLSRAKSRPPITLAGLCSKARDLSCGGKTNFDLRSTVTELWRWEKLCRHESGEYIFVPCVIRDANYYSRKEPGWSKIGDITATLSGEKAIYGFPDVVIVSDMPVPDSEDGNRWRESMSSKEEPVWIKALVREQYEKECEAHAIWMDAREEREDAFWKARREYAEAARERAAILDRQRQSLWNNHARYEIWLMRNKF